MICTHCGRCHVCGRNTSSTSATGVIVSMAGANPPTPSACIGCGAVTYTFNPGNAAANGAAVAVPYSQLVGF